MSLLVILNFGGTVAPPAPVDPTYAGGVASVAGLGGQRACHALGSQAVAGLGGQTACRALGSQTVAGVGGKTGID